MATTVSSHPVEAPPERILLHDVSWQAYETFLREIGDRNVRLTYDEGRLEIMSPSFDHEAPKKLIGRFIETLSLELGIPIRSLGSATFRREDLAKGLEPDECYYIQNESRVRGKRTLDLALDPPPDLAIEIDISYRGIRRESIYAALGVPELWRYDGSHLFGMHLDASGHYQRVENSVAFPFLRLSELERFLEPEPTTDETSLLLSFRDWAKANFVNPGSI